MWFRALLVALVAVGVAAALAVATGSTVATVAGMPVTVWAVVVAFGLNAAAFVPAAALRTERFYDATGTVTFLAVVALAWIGARAAGGEGARLVPPLLVALWAVRLGAFLIRRIRRAGSDGRFDALKATPASFAIPWTLQGLWVFLTSSAMLVAATTTVHTPTFGAAQLCGWTLWGLGFLVEVVADAQKTAFAARPENKGRFIATGLWAWSRHPNYLGEMLLWAGIFIGGVDGYHGAQWHVIASPLFVVLLLTRVSGVPLLEERADARWGDDSTYLAYKARTPVLVPRLWRRRRARGPAG